MARRLMYGWVINSAPSVATRRRFIDLGGPKAEVSSRAGPGDERRDRPAGRGSLFLHPGELGAAVTYESVTLPADLVAWPAGRSSLARLGLMVHVTARTVSIQAGPAASCLSFANSGKLPLALRPDAHRRAEL